MNNYVYQHIHPVTKEIFYIGLGTKDRAWAVTSKARSPDHREYLETLIEQGYIVSDFVEVLDRNLSREQAHLLERDLITKHKPMFNKDREQRCMSSVDIQIARELKEAGITLVEIGKQLNFHWTTVRSHL